MRVIHLSFFALRKKKRTFILLVCVLAFALYLFLPVFLEWLGGFHSMPCKCDAIKAPTTVKNVTTTVKTSTTPQQRYIQPDFKLILPYVEPKLRPQEKSMFMAVTVNSAAKGDRNRILRQTIRKTWGDANRPQNNTLKWKLFFVLGVADNQTEHEANLKEAREHNDIIIGNVTDNYRNVVIKTFMGLFWSVIRLSCKYVFKTDDDIYARVPGLITWLVNSGSPKSFYGGVISEYLRVPRDSSSKWFISWQQYSGKYFPPWCHGSYTVFSSDIIPNYLMYTYRKIPFHADDAYIGIASKELGINATNIPGFTIENNHPERVRSAKELREALTIGHKVVPEVMVKYHNFYTRNNLE